MDIIIFLVKLKYVLVVVINLSHVVVALIKKGKFDTLHLQEMKKFFENISMIKKVN